MKKKTKQILKNQKGQGVMEYVILASLIGIFCLGAVRQFGEVVNKRINNMRSEIVDNIKIK
jgi:Flp pilus assembly pilin Flp